MDYPIYQETLKELVQYVKIEKGIPYVNTAIFRLPLEDLQKDDVLHVTSEFEVTQNNKFVVQVASYIILSPNSDCQGGIIIARHNGYNITHEIHHGQTTRARQYLVKEDMPGIRYLCTMIYPASVLSKGEYLTIEQRTGHLDALIYRQSRHSL